MKQTCPYCGAQMPQEAHFCLSCFKVLPAKKGAVSIINVTKKHPTKLSKNRRDRVVSLVFSAVLVFGMLFSVYTHFAAQKTIPVAEASEEPTTDLIHTDGTEEVPIDAKAEAEEETTAPTPTLSTLTALPGGIGGMPGLTSLPQGEDEVHNPFLPGKPSLPTDSGNKNPPSTPDHPSENTEESTKPTEPETEKPATPVVPPKPSTPPPIEYENFEYKNGVITKYKGNSRVVTIPAVLGGKPVNRIAENVFNGQKNIEEIFFETNYDQPYLWVDPQCMHHLPNLKIVHFPDTDLGIHDNFAKDCPKLSNLTLSDGRYEGQYQIVDGALYYYTSRNWVLRFYCPGRKAADLTVQPWAAGLENVCNISENPYLRRIHFSKQATLFLGGAAMPKQLEGIYVEQGNFNGYSKDGVLYDYHYTGMGKDTYQVYYPPAKKDKIFRMGENARFDLARQTNAYITDIYIPNSSAFANSGFGQINFGSFTVHIAKDHPQRKELEENFYGKIVYT